MPLQIGELINSTGSWLTSNKNIYKILSSSFWTSLMIVTIVLILAILLIPPDSEDQSAYSIIKVGFYMFLGTFTIMFFHDHAFKHLYDQDNEKIGGDDFHSRVVEENPFRDALIGGDEEDNIQAELNQIGHDIEEVKDPQLNHMN